MPLIQLHSFTNLSPPLISLFCQSVPKCRLPKKSSFPPGEAKNSKTIRYYHSTKYTPSVSPFGLTAPLKGEPRRLRRWRAAMSRPYRCGGSTL